jgi:hypothetical protein
VRGVKKGVYSEKAELKDPDLVREEVTYRIMIVLRENRYLLYQPLSPLLVNWVKEGGRNDWKLLFLRFVLKGAWNGSGIEIGIGIGGRAGLEGCTLSW